MKKIIVLVLSVLGFALAGCWESDTENAIEDMGEKIEESVDDASESASDALKDNSSSESPNEQYKYKN
jgi:hypothetical protein